MLDSERHAQPVIFTSPVFLSDEDNPRNFDRVAFEANLPRIETNTNPPCQRHLSNPADPSPGAGCVNPPEGAEFYPIYTTRVGKSGCVWQLGGPHLPGTTQAFGGTSTAEYGDIQASFYPASNGIPQYIYENFHRTLPSNPCPASVGSRE